MIYQMMNGRISKRTLTKMIKAYYMCAQNGVVYKGYTEWTGDKLSYVRNISYVNVLIEELTVKILMKAAVQMNLILCG